MGKLGQISIRITKRKSANCLKWNTHSVHTTTSQSYYWWSCNVPVAVIAIRVKAVIAAVIVVVIIIEVSIALVECQQQKKYYQ